MLFTIYALIDPRDELIKYVGCTKRPIRKRLEGHFGEAKYKSKSKLSSKNKWIRDVLSSNKRPTPVILEQIDGSPQEANRLESSWIIRLRNVGLPLVNKLPTGGYGRSLRLHEVVPKLDAE